jgi:hypothetical protein
MDQTIREDRYQTINIFPNLAYFEQLGSNNDLSLAELAKKLSCSLGCVGYSVVLTWNWNLE